MPAFRFDGPAAGGRTSIRDVSASGSLSKARSLLHGRLTTPGQASDRSGAAPADPGCAGDEDGLTTAIVRQASEGVVLAAIGVLSAS